MQYLPPKVDGRCDDCPDAELLQRADDTEEVVRDRLKAYYNQTEPVIAYYRDRGEVKVCEVDGHGAPDEVTAAAAKAVDALG